MFKVGLLLKAAQYFIRRNRGTKLCRGISSTNTALSDLLGRKTAVKPPGFAAG